MYKTSKRALLLACILALIGLSISCAVDQEAPQAADQGGPPEQNQEDQQATAQEDQRGEDEEGHPPRNAFMFPPTNLQVLQVEEAEDLRPIMRAFTAGLGVGCQHCHEEDNFAADTPIKENARNMIRIVEHLNTDVFTWPNAPTATCFMCHKGHEKPELEPPTESDDTPPSQEAS